MSNYLILSLLIGIAVLAIFFAVIFIYRNKGQRIEPDYRVFFILGITWLPLGIATDNPGFLGWALSSWRSVWQTGANGKKGQHGLRWIRRNDG